MPWWILCNDKKIKTAKNALYEAIVLLRQNLGDKDHGYNSSILLARLLVWTNELDECIEICDSIMSASTFDYLALHIRGIARLPNWRHHRSFG